MNSKNIDKENLEEINELINKLIEESKEDEDKMTKIKKIIDILFED